MAIPMKVSNLMVSKLGTAVRATVSGWFCRAASRDTRVWSDLSHRRPQTDRRQRDVMPDDDFDMDDVEDKLADFIDEEQRQQRKVKFHKLRRQMHKPGAPERRLTWDAMQQIRYLKQEAPEEWTVARLAQGFSVSPDVIFRVLRSRFTPPEERRVRQDAKALARLGQPAVMADTASQGTRLLPKAAASPLLPSGAGGALVPSLSAGLPGRMVEVRAAPLSGSLLNSQPPAVQGGKLRSSQEEPGEGLHSSAAGEDGVMEEEEEEVWDGEVFTEEQLENFLEKPPSQPGPVEQRGMEFFDGDGNFLYRI